MLRPFFCPVFPLGHGLSYKAPGPAGGPPSYARRLSLTASAPLFVEDGERRGSSRPVQKDNPNAKRLRPWTVHRSAHYPYKEIRRSHAKLSYGIRLNSRASVIPSPRGIRGMGYGSVTAFGMTSITIQPDRVSGHNGRSRWPSRPSVGRTGVSAVTAYHAGLRARRTRPKFASAKSRRRQGGPYSFGISLTGWSSTATTSRPASATASR